MMKSRLLGFGLLLAMGLLSAVFVAQEKTREDRLFEEKYAAWKHSVETLPGSTSSIFDYDGVFGKNSEFADLVALGTPAIPFIIAKMQEDPLVGHAAYRIAKWRHHSRRDTTPAGKYTWTVLEFPDIVTTDHSANARVVCLRWWKEGREKTPSWFAERYADWKAAKASGDRKAEEEALQMIKDLGLAVIPLLLEKMRAGDTELMKAMPYLTDGAVAETTSVAVCVRWWGRNKRRLTIPFPD